MFKKMEDEFEDGFSDAGEEENGEFDVEEVFEDENGRIQSGHVQFAEGIKAFKTAVIVSPHGMRGRLAGCCPGDLVKQVYMSRYNGNMPKDFAASLQVVRGFDIDIAIEVYKIELELK
ncbi:hypothetical protein OROHE_000037 [Orobanche hederae]